MFQPNRYLRSLLGTGVARRLLYEVDQGANLPLIIANTSLAQSRQYAETSLEVTFDPEGKPGVANLLTIYSVLTGKVFPRQAHVTSAAEWLASLA